MAYTQSAGLRDRQYNSFVAEQSTGSFSNVAISNRVKEWAYPKAGLISSAGGAIDIYSDALNGEIIGFRNVGGNDPGSWIKTGSLTFTTSGPGDLVYDWRSGTATGDTGIVIGTPKLSLVRGQERTTVGSILTTYSRIPMSNSVIRLVGAGLGNAKSGLGVSIIYQ